MKPEIETAAVAYVAILNGPENGLGQNVCPTTGRQSHDVLHDETLKYGAVKFAAAVDAAFAEARN